MKSNLDQRKERFSALERVLLVAASKSGDYLIYSTALLGMAAIFPQLQLAPALAGLAGGVGVEAMGILLDRVTSDKLSEEEIVQAVQAAAAESTKNHLTRDDLYSALAFLRRGQRGVGGQIQALENVTRQEMEEIRFTLEQLVAAVEEPKSVKQIRLEAELQNKLDNSLIFSLEDDVLITSQVERAEQFVVESKHNQAGTVFAELASRLAENKQPVQARKYAKRAAGEYLAADNKQAAARQLVLAAEFWLTQTTFTPKLVRRDLEEAIQLGVDSRSYTVQARAVLWQAYLFLITGDADKSSENWQQTESLLLKVSDESQVELYCELALQRAMCARASEDYEHALQILREADNRDWSTKSHPKHLELLWVLLFLGAEIGDWEAVDQTYQRARKIVQSDPDPSQKGVWLMHYAGTLARRGAENRAYETYMKAMDTLQQVGTDVYQQYRLYQDMSHMLLRHANFKVSAPVLSYDSRRLDLALNALHESQSFQHIGRARQRYLERDLEEAILFAQSALMQAWRAGSWSNIADAYRTLAFLHNANEQPVEALFSAIRAGEARLVREFAGRVATVADKEEADHVTRELLVSWASIPERQSALIALTSCAAIIPADRLNSTVEFALEVLSEFREQPKHEFVRQAAGLLKELGLRLNHLQITRVLQVAIDLLSEGKHQLTQIELVKLIGTCFRSENAVDVELTEPVLKALIPLSDKDSLRDDVDTSLLHIALNSTGEVREEVKSYFEQHENWLYLSALGEPVSEADIKATIEAILKAITPRWEDDSISYSGWRPQILTNFNDVLPSSLYDLIVNGLLEAAANDEGFANQRSASIQTLRWLPEAVISERAGCIAEVLLDLCEDERREPEPDTFIPFGGPTHQITQMSLYTLGHLFKWLSQDSQERVLNQVLRASDHSDALVRQGSAMALRHIEYVAPATHLEMALQKLLVDPEPTVRHWAGAATGHLFLQPAFPEVQASYFADYLARRAPKEGDAFARAGMGYGLRVISESRECRKSSVDHALRDLAEDASYKVRTMVKSKKTTSQEER